MRYILFVMAVFSANIYADVSASEILQIMKQNQQHSVDLIKQNSQYFQKVLDDARAYYAQFVSKEWGEKNIKFSEVKQFVQYSDDLKKREIVDYENQKVTAQIVVDADKNVSKNELIEQIENIKKDTIAEAYNKDPITNKISKELKEKPNFPDESMVGDLIDINSAKDAKLEEEIVTLKDGSKKKIVSLNLPMVPDNLKKRAIKFKKIVDKYADKFGLPQSYIFATIQTESYFNPLAKSHVPAFGLMQIVPQTAGIDAYRALTGEKKVLSPTYLYNPENNIELGAQYVKIVSTKYLKGIKNANSLLYCTAVSYNAGIGNLFRVFSGSKSGRSEAIKKINSLKPEEVYEALRTSDRLADEAKNYVKHIRERRSNYVKWDM